MRKSIGAVALAGVLGLLVVHDAILAEPTPVRAAAPDSGAAPQQRRALPPKWDKRVTEPFFPDARESLVGDRPSFKDGASKTATTSAGPGAQPPPSGDSAPGDTAAGGAFAWSQLISPETLVDEIKSYPPLIKDSVKNPSEFKAGGFKVARKSFSILAVSFAVIAEYDGDPRWKNQALAARDLFAHVGLNCKAATDGTYRESKDRAEDLDNLIRGDTITAPANIEPKPDWSKVSNRPPIMSRLELAQQNRLTIWTANAGDFNKNAEQTLHEAEIVAALAEVIQREGFEFTDDKTYLGYAKDLQKAALGVASGVKTKNFDQARLAVGDMAKACSNCHGSFRN